MKNGFIPKINIGRQNLPLIPQTKFLGVLVDRQLRFSDHTNQICKKVSAYLPQTLLRTLYCRIVYPHIICLIELWNSSIQTQLIYIIRLIVK